MCTSLLWWQEINLNYLVPEMQSFHLDMGSLSGAGESDPATHFRDLYGGTGQASKYILYVYTCHTTCCGYSHSRRSSTYFEKKKEILNLICMNQSFVFSKSLHDTVDSSAD